MLTCKPILSLFHASAWTIWEQLKVLIIRGLQNYYELKALSNADRLLCKPVQGGGNHSNNL